MRDIPFAVASREPVVVDACEYVPDAYEALLEAADKGLIIIRSYSENSEQKLEWIKRCINSEYVKAQEIPEYKVFLEAKFGDILQK